VDPLLGLTFVVAELDVDVEVTPEVGVAGGAAIGLETAGARLAGAGARGLEEKLALSAGSPELPPPAAHPNARAGTASVAQKNGIHFERRGRWSFIRSSV
jgi:hypothetical protein